MKLFSAEQIKLWDQDTLEHYQISSLELMERAANAFVQRFVLKFGVESPIAVFCGTGNNGGDGLAIGRILNMMGYDVTVWLADWGQPKSPDFVANLLRLPNFGHIPLDTIDIHDFPELAPGLIIIDALLGTGINRPVDGPLEDLIHWLNTLHYKIVSVDIPSGLNMGEHTTSAIQAFHTITFQVPKLSFLLPSYERYTGTWEVVDIGLSKEFSARTATYYYLTEHKLIKSLINKRKKFSHKGTYGHALLINGSYGKGGASILSARACLRSGVGLLTNHIPLSLVQTLQTSVPEAMASVDQHSYYWSSLPLDLSRFDAVGVGCGIDQKESTHRIFHELIQHYQGRMVIDADAINLLSQYPELLNKLPSGTILTPHLKEFDRLFGQCSSCFNRLDVLRHSAQLYGLTIILKGAYTAVAFADGSVHFNSTGNPGMATAGAGDVLTGILTSLLAQGYDSQSASLIGVFVHGTAGDLAYAGASYESLIASDLIDHLGKAFHSIIH